MNEPGFPRFTPHHHHLDPAAQEFFPTLPLTIPPPPPPLFYPYPPPPPPPPPPSPAPSRTLLLSTVPSAVSESAVRRGLEVFGDVRAVQMERRREGLVTVHFYDVRDAAAALAAVQDQHMRHQYRLGCHYSHPAAATALPPPPPATARGLISGRVVWAQFITPVTAGLPDGNNQGSLIIFNLDHRVSSAYLKQIFEAYGPVKELRETPYKRHQRFVEFYDIRNAAKAMAEMNGKEIYGKALVIEFSRPGGQYSKKIFKLPQNNVNYNSQTSTPANVCSKFSPLENKNKLSIRGSPTRDFQAKGIINPSVCVSEEGSKSWSSGSSSIQECVGNLSISSSGGGYNEVCNSSTTTIVRPQLRKSNNNSNFNNNGSKKTCDNSGGGRGGGGGGGRQWKGNGGGGRRGRENNDPRFLIKQDEIVESNCKDMRTTVMIKNIPNKYSQKLLLNMLDNHCIHCNEQMPDDDGGDDRTLSSYDFVYLPIDFINKCNVGYGFVNMTSPQATLRLYKAFHHQNWEVFNSRKICEVTYARLQGIDALREHFKNSKFPGEAEEYMPVVFTPPRDGRVLSDPVPIFGRAIGDSPSGSKENQSEPQDINEVNGHNNPSYKYDDEDEEGGNDEN